MIVNVTKGTAKCDSIFNSVGISAAANGKTLTFAAAEAFVAVEKGVDKRCIVGNCMGRNEVFIVRKARAEMAFLAAWHFWPLAQIGTLLSKLADRE